MLEHRILRGIAPVSVKDAIAEERAAAERPIRVHLAAAVGAQQRARFVGQRQRLVPSKNGPRPAPGVDGAPQQSPFYAGGVRLATGDAEAAAVGGAVAVVGRHKGVGLRVKSAELREAGCILGAHGR